MSSSIRQSELLSGNLWRTLYSAFPSINFNSTDPASLNLALRQYIQTNYPEDFDDWIESSEFVAIIDLLSWLAGTIAFREDVNARENFLEIAEARESILRLARFLSYVPSRNQTSKGTVKIVQIQTDDDIIDSLGVNLANTPIIWNNPDDADWFERFVLIMNNAFIYTNPFGTPIDTLTVSGIKNQLYTLNNVPSGNPVMPFSAYVNNNSLNFELISPAFDNTLGFVETNPDLSSLFNIVYSNDGAGNNSPNTGFMCMFKQGTLQRQIFNISEPLENLLIPINVPNINDTDVWVQSVDDGGNIIKSWTKVPVIFTDNITFNSVPPNNRDIFQAVTGDQDQISLRFSDGRFGNAPVGNLRSWYRQSDGTAYQIRPTDMDRIPMVIPYLNKAGIQKTLTLTFSLQVSVTNSAPKESDEDVRRRATQVYSAQGRMVSGEDYNLFPLQTNLAIKMKAVNRVYSGHSAFIDLNDPTTTYQDATMFSDDGIVWTDSFSSFSDVYTNTGTTDDQIIINFIQPALNNTNLKNYLMENMLLLNIVPSQPLYWKRSTVQKFSSTGVFSASPTVLQPVEVGSLVANNLAQHYMTEDSLIKFDANTSWVGMTELNGTGTSFAVDGSGPITLSEPIADNNKVLQIIPAIRTVLIQSEVSEIKNFLANKISFEVWYDYSALSFVFETLGSGVIPERAIKVQTVTFRGGVWNIVTFGTRYIFESEKHVRWGFDKSYKVVDHNTGQSYHDYVEILQNNKIPIDATVWNSGINYRVNDTVNVNNSLYRCVKNHLSGSIFNVYDLDVQSLIVDPDPFTYTLPPITITPDPVNIPVSTEISYSVIPLHWSLVIDTTQVSGYIVTNKGHLYTTPPNVDIINGGGFGATAYATLGIDTINVTNGGIDFTSVPTIGITPSSSGPASATAHATMGVGNINIVGGGSGFLSTPSVIIAGGGGSGATGIAVMGFDIASVSVNASGSGYLDIPTIDTSSGNPTTPATFAVHMKLTTALVNNPGTGYVIGDVLTLLSGTGTNPTATVTSLGIFGVDISSAGTGYVIGDILTLMDGVTNTGCTITVSAINGLGGITTFNMTTPGSVTSSAVSYTVTGGSGTGAVFANPAYQIDNVSITTPGDLTVLNSSPIFSSNGTGTGATFNVDFGVLSLDLLTSGVDYETVPTIIFTSLTGTGASAIATMNNSGHVKKVTITNTGDNYTTVPAVSFVGGAGSGVFASASLKIVSILVDNSGFDYFTLTGVSVTITGGGGTGATAIVSSGNVGSIVGTNFGSNYSSVPDVIITGGGGNAASAIATLTGQTNFSDVPVNPITVSLTMPIASPNFSGTGTLSSFILITGQPAVDITYTYTRDNTGIVSLTFDSVRATTGTENVIVTFTGVSFDTNLILATNTQLSPYVISSATNPGLVFVPDNEIIQPPDIIISPTTNIDLSSGVAINPNSQITVTELWQIISDGFLKYPIDFDIIDSFKYKDGYVEPRRMMISFSDSNNDGYPDNPDGYEVLLNLIENRTYLFWETYVDDDNYTYRRPLHGVWSFTTLDSLQDYIDPSNDPSVPIPVTFVAFVIETGTFYVYGNSVLTTNQTISDKYSFQFGRGGNAADYLIDETSPGMFIVTKLDEQSLNFKWKHFAPTDHRIDPSKTNIIDIFVLTSEYDFLIRQWITNGADPASEPQAPSELSLKTTFGALEQFKMFSDEIVWRSVQYKKLFGVTADPTLQAQFKVIKSAGVQISDGEIKTRILNSINDYFSVNRWDFGETFYYTELATYIQLQLSTVISSVVIVPLHGDSEFGDLFEIRCNSNEIFLSTAQVSDIIMITSNTPSNLRIGTSN